MHGITSASYARGSKQAKRERVQRAREQANELGAVLVERQANAQASEGQRWKGIVDGTEVRVSERWKPSRKTRNYSRAQKARMVAKSTVAPKRDDRALMATMGTIHESE